MRTTTRARRSGAANSLPQGASCRVGERLPQCPRPTTSALLDEKPRNKVLAAILDGADPVFSHVFGELEHALSPETVFLDKAKYGISGLGNCGDGGEKEQGMT